MACYFVFVGEFIFMFMLYIVQISVHMYTKLIALCKKVTTRRKKEHQLS